MTHIRTITGHDIDVRFPHNGDISAEDIAHALSQLNRFCGHARRPYSVAEHSLLVCEIAERELGLDVHGRLAALLHDAHEAYCGDLHTPGKRAVGTAWHDFEGRLMVAIRRKFGLIVAAGFNGPQIHQADLMALAIERRDLLPPGGLPWPCLADVPVLGCFDLMAPHRVDMRWFEWRVYFGDKLAELQFERLEKVAGTLEQRVILQ